MRKIIIILGITVIALVGINVFNLTKIKKLDTVEVYNVTFDKDLLHSNLYSPEKFRFSQITPSSVTISWLFPNKELIVQTGMAKEYAVVSGYRIYRDGYWLTDLEKTEKSFTDTGLYPGESYTYAISTLSFDNKIEGKKSNDLSVKTKNGTVNKISFPATKITRYLAEGDSITEYNTVGEAYSYVTLVGKYLREKNSKVTIYNKGVSNSFSAGVNDRIQQEIAILQPDLVTIAIGVNDLRGESRDIGNISMAEYRNNLREILRKVITPKRSVVLLNIFYQPCCGNKLTSWNKLLRDIANEHQILIVDVFTPMESAGLTIFNGEIHPNASGHIIIAQKISESLEEYIK